MRKGNESKAAVVTWHYLAARARKARRTIFIIHCYIIISFSTRKELMTGRQKRGSHIMKTLSYASPTTTETRKKSLTRWRPF
jgi:hypothetical protein